ncbi:unnamed protein product [Spirodela intermedia]|uniref:RING-type domain-containing protein n=1 Tax=Spirodela intermedia TaxID=51605 RepID=A0A7I8JVZ4_SPIIN|nr:unnamed protein product [Spirodela intermedia]CAA6673632.1 unnamed protein product [Spirodela intermedia]
MAEFVRKGKQKVDARYENPSIPCKIEKSFQGYYSENDLHSLEDVLQDQEIVYQSLQEVRDNDMVKASSSNYPKHNRERGKGSRSSRVGNPSTSMNFNSQLLLDEALARELQCVEDNLAATSLCGTERTAGRRIIYKNEGKPRFLLLYDKALNSTERKRIILCGILHDLSAKNRVLSELQSLGEAIGTESRGLSDELISFLPPFTYKTGFFSRKDKYDECAICCDDYKNRETLITLPCQHHYHSVCIRKWLKINKVCPVCNNEVFGP